MRTWGILNLHSLSKGSRFASCTFHTQTRAAYSTGLLPALGPHQQALIVPGLFGCSNTSWFALAEQQKILLQKLEGYWSWAVSEQRIGGINPVRSFVCSFSNYCGRAVCSHVWSLYVLAVCPFMACMLWWLSFRPYYSGIMQIGPALATPVSPAI
eukprot:SAG22_NODE_1014_length_6027_cov_3.998988_6_plen_155_part_00